MIKNAKLVRPDLVLLIGETAVDLFDYFNVDELHGLSRSECLERIKDGGSYIDGMCNEIPEANGKKAYYLFLNKSSFCENKSENFGLVFHEATHYTFRKYWNDLQNREEQLITEAENLGVDICRLIF